MAFSWTKLMVVVTSLGLPIVFAQSYSNASSTNPIVDIGYARYRGLRNESLGITSYYGIRYAQSPTGELRWQPPQDIEAVSGHSADQIVDATSPGPNCLQYPPPWARVQAEVLPALNEYLNLPRGSEDCLILDVLVPNNPSSDRLPVAVQIHGGGYTVGSVATSDGSVFVSTSNNSIVWVQIQYRLGPMGFLGNADIQANGTANAGLLDQRAALNWVQRHIAAFGGDPSQVTIWGASAGGGSVHDQMILYGGDPNPPFRAAIPELPWWQPFHDDRILNAQYRLTLQASGCDSLACLRELSTDDILNATLATYNLGLDQGLYGFGDFFYGPTVDGTIIRDLPSNEFKQGHFSKVPVLTDHDTYEGVVFSPFNLTSTDPSSVTTGLSQVFQTSAPAFFTRLYQVYPSSLFNATYFQSPDVEAIAEFISPLTANNTAFYQYQTIFGDFIISCPTYYVSTAMADAGVPVYKLIYNTRLPLHGAISSVLLAPSGTQPVPQLSNATQADQLKSYYLNFVTHGDPNGVVSVTPSSMTNSSASSPASTVQLGAPLPLWPTYQQGVVAPDGTSASFTILQVNEMDLNLVEDPDASGACDFWHGQSYVVRN